MRAVARAYCSSANLGPGFDALSVALTPFYDEVEVAVGEGTWVRVEGPYARRAGGAATAVKAVRSLLGDVEVGLRVWKGVPVGLGLGSSGASAAAAVAAASLAMGGISAEKAVLAAGEGEAAAAGQPHYDNVAASLLGGFVVLHRWRAGLNIVQFRSRARFLLAIPRVETGPGKTGLMRRILPDGFPRDVMARHSGATGALVAALITGDWAAAGRAMMTSAVDRIRSTYVPCFEKAVKAAVDAGAAGASISGAGPSIIVLLGEAGWKAVASAVTNAYNECGVGVSTHLAEPAPGALETVRLLQ